MILTETIPPIDYSGSQAWHDLVQVGPIVIVVATLVAVMLADLFIRSVRRTAIAAVLAGAGVLASLVVAVAQLAGGGGGPAFYGYATGDSFALFFEVLLGVLGLMTLAVAHTYAGRRDLAGPELYVLILAAIVGMMALAASASLVTVFVSLEVLSISLYVAAGYARRERRSQEAAAKYLLMGGFASAFVLYGMALLYGATGTTVLTTIGSRLTAGDFANPLLVTAVLMLAVGFSFKISGVPFHQWTPDVYQGSPLPVTAFMSVGTKAAAFAMIIRVFGTGLAHGIGEWALLLAAVSAASMVVGNVAAIAQSDVKRLLAYSSIAQAGYILVGVVSGSRDGYGAALFYLFAYMFMTFGSFAVLIALVDRDGEHVRLADLDGFGYRNRLLGVLLTFFMVSLAGFPPTLGFAGKFFLFSAGVGAGYSWLVVLAVLTSVVSVAYYLRVVYHVWSPGVEGRTAVRSAVSLATVTGAAVLAAAISLYPAFIFAAGLTGASAVLAAAR